MNIKAIGENTPVTIALLVALCGGAFWTGTVSQRVFTNEQHNTKVDEALLNISTILSEHDRRLTRMESERP